MEPTAESLKIGSIWTYKGKGYQLRWCDIEGAPTKVKDPDSGNWHSAVIYTPVGLSTHWYIRQQQDFLSKFKPVTEENENGQQ